MGNFWTRRVTGRGSNSALEKEFGNGHKENEPEGNIGRIKIDLFRCLDMEIPLACQCQRRASPCLPSPSLSSPPLLSVCASKPSTFAALVRVILLTFNSICTWCSRCRNDFPLGSLTYPSPHPSDFGLNVTSLEKSCLVFLFMSNTLSETLPALCTLSFVTYIPVKWSILSLWLFTELLFTSSRISPPVGQESCVFGLITVFPGLLHCPSQGRHSAFMGQWVSSEE